LSAEESPISIHPDRMSDIFISYAREDSAAADAVASSLTECGLTVFWDRFIQVGVPFETIIENEVNSARVVVVLWSSSSVVSDWVRAEASAALDRGVLAPVAIDRTLPPLRYRGLQTADLSRWRSRRADSDFDRFVLGIVARLGIQAVAATATRHRDSEPPHFRFLVSCALFWAWVGSLALALTAAYDYGVVQTYPELHSRAYHGIYVALIGGAVSSGLVGAISLRRRFVRGVVQGWVLPLVLAFGELLLLIGVANLLHLLPAFSEMDALVAFVITGTIGPSMLTLSAVGIFRNLPLIR
jgi:TIR domain